MIVYNKKYGSDKVEKDDFKIVFRIAEDVTDIENIIFI